MFRKKSKPTLAFPTSESFGLSSSESDYKKSYSPISDRNVPKTCQEENILLLKRRLLFTTR
jgi:hypothetical protein